MHSYYNTQFTISYGMKDKKSFDAETIKVGPWLSFPVVRSICK